MIHNTMKTHGYIQASIAARLLGLSRSTLLRWEKQERVKSQRVGGRVWLNVADLKREVGPVAAAMLDQQQDEGA